jgi:selenocysteine-specific elongation factor
MPQTEEHFQILTYLGVKRIVIALTKSDLGQIDIIDAQIRGQLKETPFADSPIVPTSVRTGNGIKELKAAVTAELATLPPPRDIGKPRLFVDRAFNLRGIGTVVTGTLTGGRIQRGQNVVIQPQNRWARVRTIQTHGRNVDVALPGMRTAINLPDIVIGTDIERGNVVAAQPAEPGSTLDVFLTRSPRLKRSVPIKSGTSVYVHHGTARVLAKIILAERQSLASGESGFAQLRSSEPLLGFVGDRFVVRDSSNQNTIAGGVVLNADSNPNEFGSPHQCAIVAARAANPDDVDLAVWTELARAGIVQTSDLLRRSRFSATEIEAVLERLSKHGDIFLHNHVAAKMLTWRELREGAANLIDAFHKTNPERRGLELNDLRAQFNALSPAVFDTLIIDLCLNGFVRAGSTIGRSSHRAVLRANLQSAAETIRVALSEKPFDPPNRNEIAKDRPEQQALKFLIEQGDIIEISDEIVLLRSSLDQMQSMVSDFISTNGPATASQLREKVGTSRRVIIPVLEYFDRSGLTRRVGDQRVLAQQAAVVKLDDAEAAGRS